MTLYYFGDLCELRGKKSERFEDLSPRGRQQVASFDQMDEDEKKKKRLKKEIERLAQVHLRWNAPATADAQFRITRKLVAERTPPEESNADAEYIAKQKCPKISTQDWLCTPRVPPGLHILSKESCAAAERKLVADEAFAKQKLTEQCKDIGMPFAEDELARQQQAARQLMFETVAAKISAASSLVAGQKHVSFAPIWSETA